MTARNWISFLSAATIMLVSTCLAQANDIFGKQLQAYAEQPIGNPWGGSVLATVGPGIEYSGLWCCNTINVSESQILIDFNSTNAFGFFGTFNGWVFRDATNSIDDFLEVSLNPASTVAAGVSFNANEIFVNMDGLGFSSSDFVLLDVVVPEPSSAALIAIGLIAAGGRRRMRR